MKKNLFPEDYTYKALPKGLIISVSSVEGQGLFTLKPLPKDLILGITHAPGSHLFFEHGLIRTALGAFINHSETPNCKIVSNSDYFQLLTIKDIEAETELTADYFDSDCAKQCNFVK